MATPGRGPSRIDALASVGLVITDRDDFPDVVLHSPENNCLLLADSAVNGRVMDARRRENLSRIFGEHPGPLIFLTVFPNRDSFAASAEVISWETDVWIADEPDHVIHFDGGGLNGPKQKRRR